MRAAGAAYVHGLLTVCEAMLIGLDGFAKEGDERGRDCLIMPSFAEHCSDVRAWLA